MAGLSVFVESFSRIVILRDCDFFVFRPKGMLKTRSLGTKKSLFGNLITSSKRSDPRFSSHRSLARRVAQSKDLSKIEAQEWFIVDCTAGLSSCFLLASRLGGLLPVEPAAAESYSSSHTRRARTLSTYTNLQPSGTAANVLQISTTLAASAYALYVSHRPTLLYSRS